jgi:hypothetical protein
VPRARPHASAPAVSPGHGPDMPLHDQDQLHCGARGCGLAQASVDLGDGRITAARSVLRPLHGVPLVVRRPVRTTARCVVLGGRRGATGSTMPRALGADSRPAFPPVGLQRAANGATGIPCRRTAYQSKTKYRTMSPTRVAASTSTTVGRAQESCRDGTSNSRWVGKHPVAGSGEVKHRGIQVAWLTSAVARRGYVFTGRIRAPAATSRRRRIRTSDRRRLRAGGRTHLARRGTY